MPDQSAPQESITANRGRAESARAHFLGPATHAGGPGQEVSAPEAEGRSPAEPAGIPNQFLASVSHELRTPLHTLLGYLELLDSQQTPEQSAQRALIAKVRASGIHLLQITNDLLDLARMEAGRMQVNVAPARLGAAVDGAVSDAEPLAVKRQVSLINALSASAGDFSYQGDPLRVRQIVTNLLSNAIKFTAPGGEILLSAGACRDGQPAGPGPWICVRVEDTGAGIAAECLAVIFEPFGQARRGDADTGTGLGLTIARRLARLMGGDITVDSTVGVGSEFVLWLPADGTPPDGHDLGPNLAGRAR